MKNRGISELKYNMNILGLLHGQFGDIIICLPLVEHIKKIYPNCNYTANINKKYSAVVPVLQEFCPYIDNYYISDEYENFPGEKDLSFLNTKQFDLVYNPMAKPINNWFLQFHQTSLEFNTFGFVPETNSGYQINLTIPYKVQTSKNIIAFAPFAGSYNWQNNKQLTIARAQELVNEIKKLGLTIVQIGDKDEPQLENTIKPDQTYLNSVKTILECGLFIGTDTGITWCMSGFQFPTIGLYSDNFYGKDFVKNIQPVNPAATYLSENNVNEISIEKIIDAIKEKLSI